MACLCFFPADRIFSPLKKVNNNNNNINDSCWSTEHKWSVQLDFTQDAFGLHLMASLGSKKTCDVVLSQPGGRRLWGDGNEGEEGGVKVDQSPGLWFKILTVLHLSGLKRNQDPKTSCNSSLKKDKTQTVFLVLVYLYLFLLPPAVWAACLVSPESRSGRRWKVTA